MKDLEIRFIKESDIDTLVSFYEDVIDYIHTTDIKLRWEKGVYPAKDFLLEAAKNNTLITFCSGDEIIGSCVVNSNFIEEYNTVPWQIKCDASKVLILHAFAINPEYMRKGYAKKSLKMLLDYFANKGYCAMRLDVATCNYKAASLYPQLGFKFICEHKMQYPSTGVISFYMYEYLF